jgi:hypothetical protein
VEEHIETLSNSRADVVHMPIGVDGSRYFMALRDDLSGWAEFKALRKCDSKSIAKFL